jgi:hypothetical protein
MKEFKQFATEEKESQNTLLNYITANLYKLANSEDDNIKPILLMLSALIMSNMKDAKSTQMARRIAQLAVTSSK